jgi:hypothetical protein
MQAQPVTTSPSTLPLLDSSTEITYLIKKQFEELVKSGSGVTCVAFVASLFSGQNYLVALEVFKEKLPVTTEEVTFTFDDESEIKLPIAIVESLKRDCNLIDNLVGEIGLDKIPLSNCSPLIFRSLLNRLYPHAYPEKGGNDLGSHIQLIRLANYLEANTLLTRLLEELKGRLCRCSLTELLFLYNIIKNDNLAFFKSLIENELAVLFGRLLLDSNNRDEIIARYDDNGIRALSFEGQIKVDKDFIELLSGISTLEYLNLKDCMNATSEAVKKVPRTLKHLNLKKCSIHDRALIGLPPLLSLNISDCWKIGSVKDIPRSITSLNASKTGLSDEALQNLPAPLTYLDLSECKWVTDKTILQLSQSITTLILSGCKKLTNAAFDNPLPNLKHLNISKTNITSLNGVPKKLLSLDASQCFITDDCLEDFSHLQMLNISHCKLLTADVLPRLSRGLSSLFMRRLSGITIENMRKLPPFLKKLDLWGCDVEDEVITVLPFTLEDLILDGKNFKDEKCLLSLKSKLLFISLENSTISDIGVSYLPKSLLGLNVSMCRKITNGVSQCLPRGLLFLNISTCYQITSSVMKQMPDLIHLDIRCEKVTREVIDLLPKSLSILSAFEYVGAEKLPSHITVKISRNPPIINEWQ